MPFRQASHRSPDKAFYFLGARSPDESKMALANVLGSVVSASAISRRDGFGKQSMIRSDAGPIIYRQE